MAWWTDSLSSFVGGCIGAVGGLLVGRQTRSAAREARRQDRISEEYPPLQIAVERLRTWAQVQTGPFMETLPGKEFAYDNPPQLPDEGRYWSRKVRLDAAQLRNDTVHISTHSRFYARYAAPGADIEGQKDLFAQRIRRTAQMIEERVQMILDQTRFELTGERPLLPIEVHSAPQGAGWWTRSRTRIRNRWHRRTVMIRNQWRMRRG